MNYKNIFSAALLGASSLACAAEPKTGDFYVEAGYMFLNLESGSEYDDDLGVGIVKFGYNAHENLAVEVLAGTGLSDIKKNTCVGGGCIPFKIQADSTFGIYAKPKIQLGDVELFARLGYTHAKLKAKISFDGISESERESEGGFSFGVGVNYSLTKQWYVQADYMRYCDKKGIELSGPSISVGYRF
jgi:opacity protein-like surface antigen